MHPGLPFQGANILYMFMSLEEVLQNEAVGMNFSVDNQYTNSIGHIQGEVNVIHKLDCTPLAYCGFL